MKLEDYVAAHPELGNPWTPITTTGQGNAKRREQGFQDCILVEKPSPLTGHPEVWRLADSPLT